MEYVYGGAALLAIGGLTYAIYAMRSLPLALIAQGKEQLKSEQLRVAAEDARDAALARAIKAETERDMATKRAEAAEKALADELGKKGDDAAKSVSTAPDPSDALNRVLQDSARGGDHPSAPTGTGRGPGG